LYTLELSL